MRTFAQRAEVERARAEAAEEREVADVMHGLAQEAEQRTWQLRALVDRIEEDRRDLRETVAEIERVLMMAGVVCVILAGLLLWRMP
jgi:hypothetical protein